MKKLFVIASLFSFGLSYNVQAQNMQPIETDLTVTQEQVSLPMGNGQYNNTDMQPVPSTPGVEAESVQDAMSPMTATETDVNIQEIVPTTVPASNGSLELDTSVQPAQ